MSLPSLRLAAARYALQLATAEELIDTADALLTRGVYTYSLGRLACVRDPHPALRDLGPLVLAAFKESHIPVPCEEEAASIIVRHYLYGIAEGVLGPLEILRDFAKKYLWPYGRWEARELFRRAPGGERLLNLALEDRELVEIAEAYPFTDEEREARRANFGHDAEEFAARWTQAHAPAVDPAWLSANGGAVASLARAIAEGRRFEELPVLADALEEAGCTNANVLAHCRDPGAHAARCWVLDLLLGED
jgi:hypothetical protein